MPRRMIEGNERLTTLKPPLLQVAADLVIAAGVAVLRTQPTKELRGGVSLFAGSVVVGCDGVNDRLKGPKTGAGRGSVKV